jgi:Resolvase, N terminal domain
VHPLDHSDLESDPGQLPDTDGSAPSTSHSTNNATPTLTAAGAQRIFTDHACGIRDDRPGLATLLDHARAGDTVIVVASTGWVDPYPGSSAPSKP